MRFRTLIPLLALVLAGCGTSPGGSTPEAGSGGAGGSSAGGSGGLAAGGTGGSPDGGAGGGTENPKAAACADTFGAELTSSFGRLDGTVLAVVGPTDTQCAWPNDDHLVVQVVMHGAAYRMVVNVLSAGAEPRVFFATHDAPLAGPVWEEGWHPGVVLDYVNTLGAHSDGFAPHELAELVELASEPIEPGARISVFATSSGGDRAESAHLIHRNGPREDGAIVLHPDSASPRYLLFRFSDQTF